MRTLTISFGFVLLILAFTVPGIASGQNSQPNAQRLSVQAQDTCDQSPPDEYKQQISGIVDGDELVLTVSARFAGAVESIIWRGKEFINIYDHGRQISYAWQMNGHGECLNPTEPGSASDLFSPSSTSELLEVCRPQPNLLTTRIHPAFWLAPGEQGFCDANTVTAVNDELVSDHTLYKTIEIGYQGIENVIAFTAEITVPRDYATLFLEVPTGYLTYEFTDYWRFDPGSGELTEPESQDLVEPWSFVNVSQIPPILATEDGQYAMGAYSPENVLVYEILMYDVPNPADRTNKWNIIVHEVPAPAGVYTYDSFVIVGTLEQVQQGMEALFRLHPTDFSPPEGYVDGYSCEVFDGWAWDPKTPDQPIDVEVRLVNEDGSETVLWQASADRYRSDLETALGDNGQHGFSIDPAAFIRSGDRQTYRIYGLNSNPDLSARPLTPAEFSLTCPQYEVPPTEAAAEEAEVPEPDTGTGGQNTPGLPCAAGAFPLVFVAVLAVRKRRRH